VNKRVNKFVKNVDGPTQMSRRRPSSSVEDGGGMEKASDCVFPVSAKKTDGDEDDCDHEDESE